MRIHRASAVGAIGGGMLLAFIGIAYLVRTRPVVLPGYVDSLADIPDTLRKRYGGPLV